MSSYLPELTDDSSSSGGNLDETYSDSVIDDSFNDDNQRTPTITNKNPLDKQSRLTDYSHFAPAHRSSVIINDSMHQSGNQSTLPVEKSFRLPGTVRESFREVRDVIPSQTPSPSPSSSKDSDVISISTDEEEGAAYSSKKLIELTKTKQLALSDVVEKRGQVRVSNNDSSSVQVLSIEVNQKDYQAQLEKVQGLRDDLLKIRNTLRTINVNALPDKGHLLRGKEESIAFHLKKEEDFLNKMQSPKTTSEIVNINNNLTEKKLTAWRDPNNVLQWQDIEAGALAVQPRTFGKQAMATYNAQKALTMDRLEQLHGSLKNCPTENDLETDPKGLKVELMHHQRRALTWLLWREKQKPSGGILADDMGLGKTLTMISVILKAREQSEDDESSDSDSENQLDNKSKYYGGTLVVCPASLLTQWEAEIRKRCKRGLLSTELYHGNKREIKPKRLAEHDVVLSTYTVIQKENEKNGAVFRVRWERIILDEGHQIRNHKALSSIAVCRLSAKSRWVLTGTPIHNKEMDMYALLKFLRCSPFDDLNVWKRWVGDKSAGGQERLHTVISSLMLRRTKPELIERGLLNCMTERTWEIVEIKLDKNELGIYQKVLIFSRTLFSQFLHQRAEKDQDRIDANYGGLPNDPNSEYFKMRQRLLKLNKVKEIKQHEILVLLLRLRQICCHPALIKQMVDNAEELGDDDKVDDSEEFNILEQLNNLNLNDEDDGHDEPLADGLSTQESVGLTEASKGLFNPSNPVFSPNHKSSKITAALNLLNEKVLSQDNDKAIVVSQWTSFLNLISQHLKCEEIPFLQLDGQVPVNKRMEIIDKFNDPKSSVKILLLSLTAGGVGLNLVGANHLVLLDLHWNPQLELQAQDRIYRVGQMKPVFIYKLMTLDTVEERIKRIQEGKLSVANAMLTGTKQAISSKLTLNDLKMLFAV